MILCPGTRPEEHKQEDGTGTGADSHRHRQGGEVPRYKRNRLCKQDRARDGLVRDHGNHRLGWDVAFKRCVDRMVTDRDPVLRDRREADIRAIKGYICSFGSCVDDKGPGP